MFASMPERPPPVLAVMKPGEGVQKDYVCKVDWGERRRGDTCLNEAEDIVGLRCVQTGGGCLANGSSESGPLAQSTVLHGRGKEGGRVDLFPKVKGRLVPVVCDIVEVELYDGPEGVCGVGGVAISDEPVGIGDDGG